MAAVWCGVFIDGGDLYFARKQQVGALAGVADLVDGLARAELAQLHLRGEYGEFLLVEQGKQGDVAELIGRTWHGAASVEASAVTRH
jgi:hypothetical protein